MDHVKVAAADSEFKAKTLETIMQNEIANMTQQDSKKQMDEINLKKDANVSLLSSL